MKYQKSMMKIMEYLLSDREERTIERIIKETKTGRNSAFRAIKWLEEKGMIKIKKSGNQKLVAPVIDYYTLQFKYYFDSIAFKNLSSFVKLVIGVFISGIVSKSEIKSVVLFGSILKRDNFNDIDILLLGKNLNIKLIKSLSDLREKIERIFGVIINLHKSELNTDNLFKGIVVYQSPCLELSEKVKDKYLESLYWVLEAIKNQNSRTFQIAFDNSILNLSYVFCYMNNFIPKTKSDAICFFRKKYKIKNLKGLKEVAIEIGEKIFK